MGVDGMVSVTVGSKAADKEMFLAVRTAGMVARPILP